MQRDNSEVLIIGGGIIGLCVAYYLSKEGVSVSLLEEHAVGSQFSSSYGSIGLIVPSYSDPVATPGMLNQSLRWFFGANSPLYIKPQWNLDLFNWSLQFLMACKKSRSTAATPILHSWHKASLKLYQQLCEDFSIDINFEQKGGLFLYRNKQEWNHAVKSISKNNKIDINSYVVERNKLLELVPNLSSTVLGGVYHQDDARIIPSAFLRSLVSKVKQEGVSVYEQTAVFDLCLEGSKISRVNSSQGVFRPKTVIMAAGFASTMLLKSIGLKLPIQPAKGYSITAKRKKECPDIPLHLHEGRVVITPFGSKLMRIGGTLELAGNDFTVSNKRLNGIYNVLPKYLSGLEDMEIVEIWRGMRPLSSDTLPIVGMSKKIENLVLATGHGMIGISLAPVTGKLVSHIILGKDIFLPLDLLHANRYI